MELGNLPEREVSNGSIDDPRPQKKKGGLTGRIQEILNRELEDTKKKQR